MNWLARVAIFLLIITCAAETYVMRDQTEELILLENMSIDLAVKAYSTGCVTEAARWCEGVAESEDATDYCKKVMKGECDEFTSDYATELNKIHGRVK